MSTPRKGARRPRRRVPAGRPDPGGRSPAPPDRMVVAPAEPSTASHENGPTRALGLLEWAAWVVLWASAAGAGFLLGGADTAKALFMTVLLAITVLPWLRWVRRGSQFRLAPPRVAMLQGVLAIFVGFVLTLTGAYVWALALVAVELVAAMIILVRAPRPART